MTGFGRSTFVSCAYTYDIELRILNAKYTEYALRVGRPWRPFENQIKEILQAQLLRGSVELSIHSIEGKSKEAAKRVHAWTLKTLLDDVKPLAEEYRVSPLALFTALLPYAVYTEEGGEADVVEWAPCEQAVRDVCAAAWDFRKSEGVRLARECSQYGQDIQDGVQRIKAKVPERNASVRQTLQKKVAEVPIRDAARFEEELLYYLERADIAEELVRAEAHVAHWKETLVHTDPVKGKKLLFIVQELSREIHTMGAKSQYAPIQREVIFLKECLEKMKEQLMNVL